MPRGISTSEFDQLIGRAQAALPDGWVLDFANSSHVQFRSPDARQFVQADIGMYPNRWHAKVLSQDNSVVYPLGVFDSPAAAAVACALDDGAAEERDADHYSNTRATARLGAGR